MLGKHREDIDILADVLKAANHGSTGTTKTRIMINANLSYKLLEKYLAMSVESGFVDFVGSKYCLSEVGRAFLNRYDSYRNRHSTVNDNLRELNVERKRLERMYKESEDCSIPKQLR